MPSKTRSAPAAAPRAKTTANKRLVAQPAVKAQARPQRLKAAAKAAGRAAPAKKATKPTVARMVEGAEEKAANGKPDKKSAKGGSKLVRDSFTMPEADFAVIALLKGRALGVRRAAKKSELLRAGLRALAKLDAKALVAALDQLAPVKAGRPKKGH